MIYENIDIKDIDENKLIILINMTQFVKTSFGIATTFKIIVGNCDYRKIRCNMR